MSANDAIFMARDELQNIQVMHKYSKTKHKEKTAVKIIHVYIIKSIFVKILLNKSLSKLLE